LGGLGMYSCPGTLPAMSPLARVDAIQKMA
jgi:hypothetical protein